MEDEVRKESEEDILAAFAQFEDKTETPQEQAETSASVPTRDEILEEENQTEENQSVEPVKIEEIAPLNAHDIIQGARTESDTVKVEGMEDKYMLFFNEGVKDTKGMSDEALMDHIRDLEATIYKLRVRKQAFSRVEKDRLEKVSSARRAELVARDRAYRAKDKPQTPDSPKKRASSKSPLQKAIESVQKALGLTFDEAERYIMDRQKRTSSPDKGAK